MISGIKRSPTVSEFDQIQHKCSDICHCDRLFEELTSNTKGPGLLLHITAHPSRTAVGACELCRDSQQSAMRCLYVSLVTVLSITNLILLYFSLLQPSFENNT